MNRDERKAQLAEAVWRVVLDRGIGAVSVRTVAQEAGVVVGSLRHVFPTRTELLEFSAELMMRRATARIVATPPLDDPEEYALAVLRHLLPLEPDSRAELEVNIALIAEAPALPGLERIRTEAYEQLGEGCVRVVEMLTGRGRDDRTLQDARRLHAVVDGLAIHLLVRPASDDPGWALDIVRAEITRISRGADGA
jgi:AcrR family transcriptional regulator